MDNRAFAEHLLAQLSGGRDGTPAGARILIAAALPPAQAIPVLQEAAGLLRFGRRLQMLVTADTAARLQSPLLTTSAPACWEGIEAVLAAPDQNQLAHMALGLQDCAAAQAVLQALWRGVPVYLDLSCAAQCGGLTCASPALQALYDGYAARVLQMGARRVLPGAYLAALQPQPDAAPEPPAKGRMVVTGSDVRARDAQGGVWELPADAIITPAARDLAKKRGLRLERRSMRTNEEGRSNDGTG